jgi:hypothetical protein
LLQVVGDDRFELGHDGDLALDDVAPAVPVGGVVDEAHDAEHALAVDDAFAGADGVASELDALVLRARGGRRDDHGHGRPPFQVALTGDARLFGSPELAVWRVVWVLCMARRRAGRRRAGTRPSGRAR